MFQSRSAHAGVHRSDLDPAAPTAPPADGDGGGRDGVVPPPVGPDATTEAPVSAIVDELQPQPGDILVPKTRYSGFFNTNMDSVLRARGIRNLVFVGIATNVCVESSLRDAFHLEYFGVMLEDATHHLGPDFIQQATVYNVEKFFGWVSTVNDFCGVISQAAPTEA